MRIFPIVAILALGSVIPAVADAQAPDTPAAAGGQAAPAATSPARGQAETAAQQGQFAPTPLGNVQSRTLRSYWHLFIAYAVTWVLVFGYALSIGRRFGKLEAEVRELRAREGAAP